MKQQGFPKLTRLIVFLTFALFAVCVLLVLLSGADVYRRLTETGEARYARRTAVQYITTRVRQGQATEVGSFGGNDALIFRETVNGKHYLTRVYCHEGSLRELFTPETGDFSPAEGEILLPVEELALSVEGNLLTARITLPGGDVQTVLLRLPETKEADP